MLIGPPTQLLTFDDAYGAALAECSFYPNEELLHVRWHGQLMGPDIIRGVQHSAIWRDQLRFSLILNDNSDSGGDWSEALPWIQYEWLPGAVAAGVRAMAYVFSPDRDNRFASQQFVEAVRPHMAIELFEDPELALAWLASFKVGQVSLAR